MEDIYKDISCAAKQGLFKIIKKQGYKSYYKDLESLGYNIGLIWISWNNLISIDCKCIDYRCAHRSYDISEIISYLDKGIISQKNNRVIFIINKIK
jgi:hypothetical protein